MLVKITGILFFLETVGNFPRIAAAHDDAFDFHIFDEFDHTANVRFALCRKNNRSLAAQIRDHRFELNVLRRIRQSFVFGVGFLNFGVNFRIPEHFFQVLRYFYRGV